MSRSQRMFDAMCKDIEPKEGGSGSGTTLSQNDLQAFEKRLTDSVTERIQKVQDQIASKIDEKINGALEKASAAQPMPATETNAEKETENKEETNNG